MTKKIKEMQSIDVATLLEQIEFIREAEAAFKFNESDPNIGEFTRQTRRFELQGVLLVLRQDLTDMVELSLSSPTTNDERKVA